MNNVQKDNLYPLPVGINDSERLNLLNDIYQEYSIESFKKANLKEGDKVAIFGCGNGALMEYIYSKIGDTGKLLCLDISPEQIALTKIVTENLSMKNVTYLVNDVQNIEGDESYDIVYCRFLLIHLLKPKKAIENMLSFLKNKGHIICEEYSSNVRYCYPEIEAIEKIREVSKIIREKIGIDNTYGEKLYYEMLDFDVKPISFNLNIPIDNSPYKKNLTLLSWEAMKKNKNITNIVSIKDLDFIINNLREYVNDEKVFQSVGTIFHFIGAKNKNYETPYSLSINKIPSK